jgi:hypothetical protein
MQPETQFKFDDDTVDVILSKTKVTLPRLVLPEPLQLSQESRSSMTVLLFRMIKENNSKPLNQFLSQQPKTLRLVKSLNYAFRMAVAAQMPQHLPTLVQYGANIMNVGPVTGNIAMHSAMRFGDEKSIVALLNLAVEYHSHAPLAQLVHRNESNESPLDFLGRLPFLERICLCSTIRSSRAWGLAVTLDPPLTERLGEILRAFCRGKNEVTPTNAPGSI